MSHERSQRIFCGRCNVPIDVLSSSNPDPIIRCPVCGESESLEEARTEAGRHSAHMLLSHMLDLKERSRLFFRFVWGSEPQ